MRKILALSPVLIDFKLNKRVIYAIFNSCRFVIVSLVNITKQIIYAILASFRFVIASLVNINKRIFHIIITSWNLLITGMVNITRQVINAAVAFLHAILNSCRFVIVSLVNITKQIIYATVAFFHATARFFGFVISSLVRLIKQFISAVLSSLDTIADFLDDTINYLVRINKQIISGVVRFFDSVINSLFRVKKQFINGVALFGITVVNSSSAGAIILGALVAAVLASLIGLNKKLIYGVVRGFVNSLSAVKNSISLVIKSLVRINKQIIYEVLRFCSFVISSLVNINKRIFHIIITSWNLLITDLANIMKKGMYAAVAFFGITIVSSSGFIADNFIKINKQVSSGVVNGIVSSFSTIVSSWGAFLLSLGNFVSSFSAGAIILGALVAAVLASFVRINKKLIHATVTFPRFVITGLIKITKQVIYALPTSLRKIINSCSFIIASLVVIVAFITATTYTQLAMAIILYPLLVYFAFKAFPRKTRSYKETLVTEVQPPPVNMAERIEEDKRENVGISDIDKRAFLKLIGAAGLSLFLFSIFNKKAEGLFFKSLPGSGRVSLEDIAGKKIDPAQAHPTDGYRISEIDDNVITYYGFTNKDGAWFVMREDTDTGSFRYTKGDSNFPGNWTSREKLKYDYFNDVF